MKQKEDSFPTISAADLLRMKITYDIIISDFGRDSTIEYLYRVSSLEKKLIERVLVRDNLEFFDEYRRIMYTVVADLSYFKKPAIAKSTENQGYLKEDILIGLGSSPMSKDFVDRVTLSVIQEALAAIDRGHEYLRVIIPCNTLSDLAKEIRRVICSVSELKRLTKASAVKISEVERITTWKIDIYTVPEAVVRHLGRTKRYDETINLIVLGTRDTNAIYGRLTEASAINVLPLKNWEYELINKTIVASIGNCKDSLNSYCQRLQEELIKPQIGLSDNLIVLEACTDFRLGLGLSSLEVFTEAIVADSYHNLISL
jgi:hypothetical protein